MATLTCFSPAKLNLFLHITGRRQDGYHALQTYFQLLNFGDTLSFTKNTTGKIILETDLILEAKENLITRAAKLLQQHTGTQLGATIQLEKKIPLGAGLGGGSSNAATTLVALNQLWQTHCSSQTLQQLGLQLGADVPVFVLGQSAWAEGIGEKLTPFTLEPAWFLVVTPNIHISTQSIFHHPQLTRNTLPITVAAFRAGAVTQNDCQPLVCQLYPEIHAVLHWFQQQGIEARLTGTGASCFAKFADQTTAIIAQEKLPHDWHSFVAQSI